MAQLFVQSPEAFAAIENLRQFAEATPLSTASYTARMKQGKDPVPTEYNVVLEPGLRICYTIDTNPICELRHLSVSYRARLPSPWIVEELLKLLQFKNPMSDCFIYVEDGYAINVVEPRQGGLFPQDIQRAFDASYNSVSD